MALPQKTIVAIFAVCVATTAAAARLELFEPHYGVTEELQLDTAPLFGDRSLTLADLRQNVQEASTYDEFLASLNSAAPSLFENFVLLHTSGSLQPASSQQPRVLAHGYGMVLAFAESASSAKRTVEIMALNETSRELEFHEIEFLPGQEPRFRESPEECLSCHGRPAKPLWSPYDFWPKAYGSHVGRIPDNSAEERAAQQFWNGDRPGVYAYLQANDVEYGNDLEVFSDFITNLNFIRIGKEVRDLRPTLSGFEPAILGVLSSCTEFSDVDFEDFFPPTLYEQFPINLADLVIDTKAKRDAFKEFQESIYKEAFDGQASRVGHERLEGEIKQLAQLRFLFENLGQSAQWMTMANVKNPILLSTPSNFGADLTVALADVFADVTREERPEVFSMDATPYSFAPEWLRFDCQSLARISRERLQTFDLNRLAEPGARLSSAVRPTAVSRCASCHIERTDAGVPEIPFHDNAALRDALLADGGRLLRAMQDRLTRTDALQMPPGGGLSSEEISSLMVVIDRMTEQ